MGSTEESSSGSDGIIRGNRTRADFLFLEELGEGSYSTVYLGSEKETHRRFAIKVCSKAQIVREKKVCIFRYIDYVGVDIVSFHRSSIYGVYSVFQITQIFREKECLTLLSTKENYHPFVIRLYCTFQDAESLYFVLSLASRKDLLAVLRKKKKLTIEEAKFVNAEITVALGEFSTFDNNYSTISSFRAYPQVGSSPPRCQARECTTL